MYSIGNIGKTVSSSILTPLPFIYTILSVIFHIFTESVPDSSSGSRSETSRELYTQEMEVSDHYVLFNITVPSRESVIMAELRMFIIVQNGNQQGDIAQFTLYQDLNSHLELVTSRIVYKQSNGWQSFDLTDFVRLVVKRSHSKASTIKTRRIRSKSVRLQIHIQTVMGNVGRSSLDVDISHDIEFEPLLVVYSDGDYKSHMQQKPEQKQKDLAIDRMNNCVESITIPNQRNSATMDRSKRDSVRRNLCRRRPMQVVFKDIGWDEWVIAPRQYQAFKCSGICVFPLSDNWNPTTHSIIQTLAHENDQVHIENPCCVPIELSPISMLYLDEANVLTYKYRYEGMVVNKCGCH